jgi:hypothetical protein
VEVKRPKNLGYFCNFQKTAQSKKSPNTPKFAQSGHPAITFQEKSCAHLDLFEATIEIFTERPRSRKFCQFHT